MLEKLDKDFFEFIEKHQSDNVDNLRLKFHGKIFSFPFELALTQIYCKQKYKNKFQILWMSAMAIDEIPSLRPSNPRRSVVVAFTETASLSTFITLARVSRIFSM